MQGDAPFPTSRRQIRSLWRREPDCGVNLGQQDLLFCPEQVIVAHAWSTAVRLRSSSRSFIERAEVLHGEFLDVNMALCA